MLPLLVEVVNTETGARAEAGFRRSPVRIGRNPLNDLAIDESFVSQWHGIIRFDEDNTRFLDLGSTNGTKVDGERVEKNLEVELEPRTQLAIGPLRLSAVRVALSDDQILPRRASPFQLGGTQRRGKGVGEGGTVALGETGGDAPLDGPTLHEGGLAAEPTPLVDRGQRQKALAERLGPLYAALEEAHRTMENAVQEGLVEAVDADERGARLEWLRGAYPRAFAEVGASAEPAGAVDIPGWLELLAPGASARWSDTTAALDRAGAILDGFAAAFVDLDVGQAQIRKELGLEDVERADGLPRFDDSRDLLAYLLDADQDALMRLDELARSFAGLAVHQLAIVAGATDGAMRLLQTLSPQALGAAPRGGLVKTRFGVSDMLWPWSAAGHYYRFAAQHLDLSTGQRFTKHLFGASFARAYRRVTGR